MGEILTACVGCGAAQSPTQVLYDREGNPICDACHARADLLETDRRAAGNIRKAAFTCAAAGLASLAAPVYGFLTACLVIAATSGGYALVSLGRGNERFTRHLSPAQRNVAMACAIGGLVLAVAAFLGGPLVGMPDSQRQHLQQGLSP